MADEIGAVTAKTTKQFTKRNTSSFFPSNPKAFKQQALQWANTYEVCTYLDSHQYQDDVYGQYQMLIGAGVISECTLDTADSLSGFAALKDFRQKQQDWSFAYLTYDLKNDVEALSSNYFDVLDFSKIHVYQPEIVIEYLPDGYLHIHTMERSPEEIYHQILAQPVSIPSAQICEGLQARFTRTEYLERIQRIQQHIQRGDIYEMNFCQEYFLEGCQVPALPLFHKLNQLGKAPFSGYYRHRHRYLMCASPERYLQKTGYIIRTQPIKGTIKRGESSQEDQKLKTELYESAKDRSENVMIVDLVRNDLSRTCKPGTVEVEELYGIYGFARVWQMISTIRGELEEGMTGIDAIEASFPMGSMTGAPKIRAMQLIEDYERSRRGLYSGSIGYFKPNGDFDFNVIIRSLLYNSTNQYLSFQVGGAIVADSVPEKEYEECLLKAKGMLKALDVEV